MFRVILVDLTTFCFKFTVFHHSNYYYFYQSQGCAGVSLVQIRKAFMKNSQFVEKEVPVGFLTPR